MEGLGSLPFLAAMFAIMYFFFFRPQIKKQKDQQKFGDTLQRGDTVVTSGGIIGKIHKIEDDSITVVTEGKTSIQVMRHMVSAELSKAYVPKKSESKKADA